MGAELHSACMQVAHSTLEAVYQTHEPNCCLARTCNDFVFLLEQCSWQVHEKTCFLCRSKSACQDNHLLSAKHHQHSGVADNQLHIAAAAGVSGPSREGSTRSVQAHIAVVLQSTPQNWVMMEEEEKVNACTEAQCRAGIKSVS